MTPTLTHLNQALDTADRLGLVAMDIIDLRITDAGELRAIVIRAKHPSDPKKPFPLELPVQGAATLPGAS